LAREPPLTRKPRTARSAVPREERARRAPSGGGRRFAQQDHAPAQWPTIRWHPRYWRINWRRGLIRLWLLASVLWAGYWVYKLQLSCAFWFAPWCESPLHVDWPNQSMALGLALILLSGPVLVLLLGLVTIWAIKGFLARRAP
jgi:hypothetical protein